VDSYVGEWGRLNEFHKWKFQKFTVYLRIRTWSPFCNGIILEIHSYLKSKSPPLQGESKEAKHYQTSNTFSPRDSVRNLMCVGSLLLSRLFLNVVLMNSNFVNRPHKQLHLASLSAIRKWRWVVTTHQLHQKDDWRVPGSDFIFVNQNYQLILQSRCVWKTILSNYLFVNLISCP